ncbi:uncharacterized protein LOC129906905 [Episyrphus balteatus]|uniref:uncharacterized protein LOC129906905 n=1 Tax=Episyrphus balteatus TaxID=286459 RepID=UPI00248655DF|nr:uncharacterized protein LOC129906905 [Episyrphus balteatus]
MTASNEWLFKVKNTFVLNLKCASEQYTATLNGSGILKMELPCEASAKGFKLFYEYHSEVFTEYKQPMVDHSELVQALQASSVPAKEASTPKLLPIRIGNHKHFSNNLNIGRKSIEELEKDWNQLNGERKAADQDWELTLHRYSIMSMITLGAVAIIAIFLVRFFRSRSKFTKSTRTKTPSLTSLALREVNFYQTPKRRAPATPLAETNNSTAVFSITSARV